MKPVLLLLVGVVVMVAARYFWHSPVEVPNNTDVRRRIKAIAAEREQELRDRYRVLAKERA